MTLSVAADTSEKEKAFTDKYKEAWDAKDTATLDAFLYTQGADPGIVELYKMIMFIEARTAANAGEKISSIELVDLTPDEAKKASTPIDSPTGGKDCPTLKPTKKLIINNKEKDTSQYFVPCILLPWACEIAEKDGNFVIPVPGPCK